MRDVVLIVPPLAVPEVVGRAGYGMRDPRPVLLTLVASVLRDSEDRMRVAVAVAAAASTRA